MSAEQIFISYAREDAKEMEELREHLRGASDVFDVWADCELQGGEEWEEKIRQKIRGSSLAVLFITRHFLNSEFIGKVEVPEILERAEKKDDGP